ncbi:hypothetical protein OG21DRAFT_15925 [Imleria badia]|nr:hypothetical protein OG21DRAFT_15925 [Imleria badia]
MAIPRGRLLSASLHPHSPCCSQGHTVALPWFRAKAGDASARWDPIPWCLAANYPRTLLHGIMDLARRRILPKARAPPSRR